MVNRGGVEDEHTFRPEELAGDVERLAAHDHDLLAIEELFGDCAGEASEEVSLAVHDDLIFASVLVTSCAGLAIRPFQEASAMWNGDTYHRLKRRHLGGMGVMSRWCRDAAPVRREAAVCASANDGFA